jgi:ATPase subunit of ABC transporter with duplicated ATPase domains
MIDLNKPGELIIKQRYSPRMKLLLAVVAAAALLASAGFIYNYGLNRAGFEAQSAQETQQTLQDEMRKLQDENRELQESLARSQRTIQMDQAAYQDLDKSLKASAQEIVKLREELNFYRNIISPADKKSGLRIQNLYIEPAGGTNQFRYKLVLIQALKHESTVQGRAIIEVSGMQVGEDTLLRFPAANERPIQVNFKYFQDIEGKLELPRNFQPKRVKVYIKTPGGTSLAEATYAWPLG